MKKTILTALCVAVLALAAVSFAEPEKGMMGKGMMGEGMMGQNKMGMMDKGMTGKRGMMGMCPMHGMMMKSMMETAVVASSDGGVIVFANGKLTKYDKDLNVVKEVAVKVDVENMQGTMMEMKAKCAMCPKMMDGIMGNGDGSQQDAAPAAASEEADHESHH